MASVMDRPRSRLRLPNDVNLFCRYVGNNGTTAIIQMKLPKQPFVTALCIHQTQLSLALGVGVGSSLNDPMLVSAVVQLYRPNDLFE